MKQIRVCIIGQGRSGRNIHGRYLKSVEDQYKIVAVVDPLPERRQRAEEENGCPTFSDYRDILDRDDLDLVINCMPSHLHVPATLDLLNHGFNVLCEKPLARKMDEVDQLIAASTQRPDQVFAIFQQSRYAPYFQQVRKVIDSGDLGRIVQISIAFNGFARRWDWQCVQANNGGNLLNTGPHPVDQALQLFGDAMPNVTCFMDRANTFGDAEDYVKLIMHKPGHPLIDLEISSCCAYPSFTYNVQGTQGGLKGSMTEIEWKYFRPEEAPEQELITTPLITEDGTPAYCGEKLTWYEDSWTVPKGQKDLFHTISGGFYDMLHKTLSEGAPLEITPQQVRRQIAVIEECHRQNPLSRKYPPSFS